MAASALDEPLALEREQVKPSNAPAAVKHDPELAQVGRIASSAHVANDRVVRFLLARGQLPCCVHAWIVGVKPCTRNASRYAKTDTLAHAVAP
jgi:hypothetical protein